VAGEGHDESHAGEEADGVLGDPFKAFVEEVDHGEVYLGGVVGYVDGGGGRTSSQGGAFGREILRAPNDDGGIEKEIGANRPREAFHQMGLVGSVEAQ